MLGTHTKVHETLKKEGVMGAKTITFLNQLEQVGVVLHSLDSLHWSILALHPLVTILNGEALHHLGDTN